MAQTHTRTESAMQSIQICSRMVKIVCVFWRFTFCIKALHWSQQLQDANDFTFFLLVGGLFKKKHPHRKLYFEKTSFQILLVHIKRYSNRPHACRKSILNKSQYSLQPNMAVPCTRYCLLGTLY